MLDYVYGHDEVVAEFVASLIPTASRGFGNSKAIGVVEDGRLIAGLVYHNYNPEAGVIEISGRCRIMADTRDAEARASLAPFLQIGCQMVMMVVSDATNVRYVNQRNRLCVRSLTSHAGTRPRRHRLSLTYEPGKPTKFNRAAQCLTTSIHKRTDSATRSRRR